MQLIGFCMISLPHPLRELIKLPFLSVPQEAQELFLYPLPSLSVKEHPELFIVSLRIRVIFLAF